MVFFQLEKYINERGGKVLLKDITSPSTDTWGDATAAMETALAMARRVNQSIIDLHEVSDKHNDAQLSDFLEGT